MKILLTPSKIMNLYSESHLYSSGLLTVFKLLLEIVVGLPLALALYTVLERFPGLYNDIHSVDCNLYGGDAYSSVFWF